MQNILFSWLFLFYVYNYAFGQHLNISFDIEKKLGIKYIKITENYTTKTKTYPATVVDNPLLSFDVSVASDGIVEQVFVKQGDRVKKGTILVKVYSPRIAELQSNIQMAKIKLKTAKDILEREEMLYKEEVIPYTRFYSAKIEYERAKGEFEALKRALASFGEVEGNSIILRSKVDGFVAESMAVRGMPVSVGDSIMKIHSHKVLWVESMVPFEDTKYIKVGDKAFVINPEGKKIEGKVILINHEIDPKTARNMVRVEVKNPSEIIKPNMFVNVEFPVSKVEGIFVPSQAVIQKDGKNYVFVKSADKISPREVKVGVTYGRETQILKGLKSGEEVVIDGVIFLKSHFFGGGGE